jgi:hypothetical protein
MPAEREIDGDAAMMTAAEIVQEIAEGEELLAQMIAENAPEEQIREVRKSIEWYRLQLEFLAAHNPVDVAALKNLRARMDWMLHERELDKERAPRVYAWEDANLNPLATLLTDAAAGVDILQLIINSIWVDEGLTNPPTLKMVTADDLPERAGGYADRETIKILSDQCLDTALFHELAHCIAKARLVDDGHGPFWLGIYMRLLNKLMSRSFKMKAMRASATAAGLQFKTRLPRKPW